MLTMLLAMVGGFEVVLILLVVILMFLGKKFPDIAKGLEEGREASKRSSPEETHNDHEANVKDVFIMSVASGFGFGETPFAQGTFGSLLGVLWFGLLVTTGSIWLFALGIILSIFASVWLCGEAERITGQKDPSIVVIDEVIAIPICFTAWVVLAWLKHAEFPGPEYFFSVTNLPWVVAVFAAFRFFDIAKPWPVFQSQSLPGGWGVTVDDVLAALYVNVLTLVAYFFYPAFLN